MALSRITTAAAVGLGALILVGPTAHDTSAQSARPSVSIFDGKTLNGWHKPEGVPADYRGGKWDVIDGALVGDQDPPGMGGFLVTDYMAGKVLQVSPTGESRLVRQFKPGLADHTFLYAQGDILIVPHMNENTVAAYDISADMK